MLKSLLDIVKQLLGLAKDTEENKADIKAVQSQLEEMTETLRIVIFELQRLKENEAHEREKLALRLENSLLRSERALPPASTDEQIRLAELQDQVADLQKQGEDLVDGMERLST